MIKDFRYVNERYNSLFGFERSSSCLIIISHHSFIDIVSFCLSNKTTIVVSSYAMPLNESYVD